MMMDGEVIHEGTEVVPHGVPSPAKGNPKMAVPHEAPPRAQPMPPQARRIAPPRNPNSGVTNTRGTMPPPHQHQYPVRPANGTTNLRKRAT